MIILDTDVISEVMRGRAKADPTVLRWLETIADQPVTTVVNRAEILAGITVLPTGWRRDRLGSAAAAAFGVLGVCLPLVPDCAQAYADIVATRWADGRPIGGMDTLIASIARVSDAALATRDLQDLAGLDIELVDPWARS